MPRHLTLPTPEKQLCNTKEKCQQRLIHSCLPSHRVLQVYFNEHHEPKPPSCAQLQPKRDSGTLHEKKIRLSMGDEHLPGNTCTCARSSHGPSVRTSRRVFHSIRNSPGLKGEFSTGTKDIRRIVGGAEGGRRGACQRRVREGEGGGEGRARAKAS